MKNKMLKKGLAIGMSAFLLASSLAPVSVQAASWKQNKTGWWWQEDNGSYPVSQWKVINGNGMLLMNGDICAPAGFSVMENGIILALQMMDL